jgi:hypothetical protein
MVVEIPPPVSQTRIGSVLSSHESYRFAYKQWDRVVRRAVNFYYKYGDVPVFVNEPLWLFSKSFIDTKLFYCAKIQQLRKQLNRGRRADTGRWSIITPSPDLADLYIRDEQTGASIHLGAAAIPPDIVLVLKGRRTLGVDWTNLNFAGVFGQTLPQVLKRTAREVFEGKWGELIYQHDREVRSLKAPKLYLESVPVGGLLQDRFAFRFPYISPGQETFTQIGVIAFDAASITNSGDVDQSFQSDVDQNRLKRRGTFSA